MLMKHFQSSTSIALVISLSLPGPLLAQDEAQALPLVDQLSVCGKGVPIPCITKNGQVRIETNKVVPKSEAESILAETGAAKASDAVSAASSDTPAGTAPTKPPADNLPVADSEKPNATGSAANGADEPAQQPVAPTADTATSPVPKPPEVEVEADTDTGTDTTGASTPAAPVDDASKTAADAVQPATEQPAIETNPQPTSTDQADAAAKPVGEVVATPMTEQQQAESDAAKAEAEAQADAAAQAETPAAAASDTAAPPSEITTQTVTKDQARSSDEDFATSAAGKAAPTASATAEQKADSGLSDFEKVLLLGAGAVAVGAILKNGDRVRANTGDRVVVERDGELRVLKDDDALLRQPGSEVKTETFNDGSTRTLLNRPDGTQVETVRDSNGRVLRRVVVQPNGNRTVLFDDTRQFRPVDVKALPQQRQTRSIDYGNNADLLRDALAASSNESTLQRSYSLSQIRNIRAVRELVPEVNLNNVTFESGSAAIQPTQAEKLSALGQAMREAINRNPGAVFLIEGHTDAVGDAAYNLTLSDRRAESMALALSEYFAVPPENLVVQGYGERYLKVQTALAERANRRVTVRPITPLLGEVVATQQ